MQQGDAQEPTTGLLTGGGAKEYIANKCKSLISAQPLDPIQIVNICNNDSMTISLSNCSLTACPHHVMHAHLDSWSSLVATARHLFGAPSPQYLNAITIATLQAIADAEATSIFIMEGTPFKNIWPATKQLTINLPDRSQVKSTHLCNITMPGLPIVLTGHIVPRLLIASLIGILVLCKAGFKVVYTKNFCNVIYNNKVILRGTKGPSTDLWTLPINATEDMINTENHMGKSQLNPKQPQIAAFTHSVQTRVNPVMFAHQSLCNPKISTMLKAMWRGFLKGCPNINEKLILKYLNPCPTTAKGHMKRSQHGIRSTTPKMPLLGTEPIPIIPVHLPHVLPLFQQPLPSEGPAYCALQGHKLIEMDDKESIANVFYFGAFAVKITGWCTMIWQDYSGSSCWMAAFVFSSCTIMKQMQFWPSPFLPLTTSAFSTHTKCSSMTSPQKGSHQKSTSWTTKQPSTSKHS